MTVPLNEILENAESLEGKKAFMGLGVGQDGVPIDLIRVHLLGYGIKDFTILLADNFSSDAIAGKSGLNALDLGRAVSIYNGTLSVFKGIWPTDSQIRATSEFMDTQDYRFTLKHIEQIANERSLHDQITDISTEWGDTAEDRWRFAINELAVIEHLRRTDGITIKIGPPSERKYDVVSALVSPGMAFLYMLPTRGLAKRSAEPSPYSIEGGIREISDNRILITDDPDTVQEKLDLGGLGAHKYFAILGSLAGRAMGHLYPCASEILKQPDQKIREMAEQFLLDNVIAPWRRTQGIAIYRKTDARKLYDDTIKAAKLKLRGRTPDLVNFVRPEINSIDSQIVALLAERIKYPRNETVYNEEFPGLDAVGISSVIPGAFYAPFIEILGTPEGNGESAPVGLDLELMNLLQKRITVGYHVAVAKMAVNKSVFDGEREKIVIANNMKAAERFNNLDPQRIRKAYMFIMGAVKDLEDMFISRYALDFAR